MVKKCCDDDSARIQGDSISPGKKYLIRIPISEPSESVVFFASYFAGAPGTIE